MDFVESVEVDAGRAVGEKVAALLDGKLDSGLKDLFGVVFDRFK